ncbi:DUF349 domain-containing protein [Clostridium sp. B9]|uniref:DUF349 domain-containing protein n=1 Tax=Clostridium sp. B9 TaxID=3423224 RepID=UPI003D2F43C4
MTTNESNYIDKTKISEDTEDFAKALAAEEENSCKRKKEVIEKIKELAKNAQNWKEANNEFNALLEEFNNIYYYDQESENTLKQELREAKNEFFSARKAFFEKANEEYKENAIKKEDVIKRLESLVYTEDIKTCDMTSKALSEEFYAIGFAGRDAQNDLFNRFKEARNKAQESRKAAMAGLKEDFVNKAARKNEIIAELKGLVNNENWKEATEKFNALCEEFKGIGFSGKEGNEEISIGYKEAKDAFFAKRQEFFDALKAENKVNIEKRIALIEDLKKLYENDSWKEASAKVKEISDEFFKIGFCGKEENERLINEFKEVRDGFYAARQSYFDNINAARANKQKDFLNGLLKNKDEFVKKLKKYISQDEERLSDFTDRLFNVRPGGNSLETIEKFQGIIEDIKGRIENNKAKVKEVQGEMQEIRNELNNLK